MHECYWSRPIECATGYSGNARLVNAQEYPDLGRLRRKARANRKRQDGLHVFDGSDQIEGMSRKMTGADQMMYRIGFGRG